MELFKNSVIIGLITASSIGAMKQGTVKWQSSKRRVPCLTFEQEQKNILISLKKYRSIKAQRRRRNGKTSQQSLKDDVLYDRIIGDLENNKITATVIKRSAEKVLVSISFYKSYLFEFDAGITKLMDVVAVKKT